MEELTLKIYAKINLVLDIRGVFEDGYHNLDMIMSSCSLYDEIKATKSQKNEVYMDGVLQNDKNTATRALDILTLAYGYKLRIDIKKGIPMSAGVGGSSADAAGVFKAYSILYGVETIYMHKLAQSIGSDVIYMMHGGPARVRGKGELVFPIDNFCETNMVILQKEVGASTQAVYKKYDELGSVAKDSFLLENGTHVFNVLEESAISLCPSIQTSIDELKKYTDKVFMTGSGSAVLGIFKTQKEAQDCVDKIGDDFVFKKAVKTMPSGIEVVE